MKELLHAACIIALMFLFVANIDFGRANGRQQVVGTALALCGIVALLVLVFAS